MASQAFVYNAIFFTYAAGAVEILRHRRSTSLASTSGPSPSAPFPEADACSALCSNTARRKPVIAATYALADILLAVTGQLFEMGVLTATHP